MLCDFFIVWSWPPYSSSSYYGAVLSTMISASGMLINPGTRLYIYAPKVTVVPPSLAGVKIQPFLPVTYSRNGINIF